MGVKDKFLIKLGALGLSGIFATFQSAGAVPKPLSMQERTGLRDVLGANRSKEGIERAISEVASRPGVDAKDLASSVARLNLSPDDMKVAMKAIADSENVSEQKVSEYLVQETLFHSGQEKASNIAKTLNDLPSVDINVGSQDSSTDTPFEFDGSNT